MSENAGLDRLVERVAELRPLPAAAVRILEVTESDRFSAHDLATVIAADQAVTAKLLRLSNSVFYGFPRRIATVRDAVVLLGFREVRAAVLASCVIESMPAGATIDYQSFWQFSLSVGMLSELLARGEGQHRDHAFTAGVLHNIGLLAIDQQLPGALPAAIEAAGQRGVRVAEALREMLGYTDAEAGAALAQRWSFPPPLVQAIAEHATALDRLPDGGSLAAFVVRACHFARSYGLTDGLPTQPAIDTEEPPDAGQWGRPPLSSLLAQEGGMDRVIQRANAFVRGATVS